MSSPDSSPAASLDPALRHAAEAWMRLDPDTATRAALQRLLEAGDVDGLRACMGQRLDFGTAGIRGELGPGPGRLNRLVARQTAAGLGRVLVQDFGDAADRGVVVGYDGRHGSRAFAEDVAGVLGALGLRVWLYDDVVPTPLLAHALRHLGCVAGVMVTASHNPPQDNGIKVYWEHGAQIVPPIDRRISDEIRAVAEAEEAVAAADLPTLRVEGLLRAVPAGQREAYVQAVLGLRVHSEVGARAVYTAMHGVGWSLLAEVLTAAGHTLPVAVASQRDPDPDFPTVAFPNPEEPGALDLAMRLAEAEGAELIIANDPDADRLAVALPLPDGSGWRRLTGNEVGLLLAEDLLAHRRGHIGEAQPLVCTTIVSSSMLADIAAAHGAAHAEVLTGFKWLAQAAMAWEGPFVLGFEEALGYSAGGLIRDKDGVSTALLILDLASAMKARGLGLGDALDALERRYGIAASGQRSLTLPGADGQQRIADLMHRLRTEPPEAFAGHDVLRIRDVQQGTVQDRRTGQTTPLDLPRSNVLAFDLDGGCRVLVRPSGTEPKLKIYLEAKEAVRPDEELLVARARAEAAVASLGADAWARIVGEDAPAG